MWKKWLAECLRKENGTRLVVVLGLAGMICILLSGWMKPEETASAEPPSDLGAQQEQYRLQLQEELAGMLGEIAGVGRVEVLVTLGGSEEYHYAIEGDEMISDEQVKHSSSYVTVGGSRTPLMESVSHPPVTGVVVACEGGMRSTVQEDVYRTVAVACGISTARIYVTTLN